MKQNMLVIVAVVAVIIIIVVGYVGYSCLNAGNSDNNPETSPTPTPQLTTQEEARNDAIAYIRTNHTETEQYIPTTITWEGGETTPEGLVGSETYIYTSGGWNVTMQYAVVLDPVYTVAVTYTDAGATEGSYMIIWVGTWQSGTVTETTYSFIA